MKLILSKEAHPKHHFTALKLCLENSADLALLY